jgi:hypothetical protein
MQTITILNNKILINDIEKSFSNSISFQRYFINLIKYNKKNQINYIIIK